ncbi:MAG: molybdenum cofactor guanylyltransferase MobA [Pseudomonadota bacterium]|nr:molybdenum cofactor guanylyltransferase MobA [Pseudomonadota bacterium]
MTGSKDAVIGVLLAGGRSRRMGGGDKCLLPLGGKPMIAHVIDRLRPQVKGLVLNANGDPARFEKLALPVVADPVEDFAGPLAGVLAGLDWACAHHPQARWIVTAATDTPFFPSDMVVRLLKATGGKYPAIALASSQGRLHPVFGLWPTALAGDLRDALQAGTRKVLDWVDRHPRYEVEFGPVTVGGQDTDPFFNANDPQEFARAEALLTETAT